MSMDTLDFMISCGQCLKEIDRQNGVVLSCGDFVCSQCSFLITKCPMCGKERFKKIKLADSESMPDEVLKNTSNVSLELESVFHIFSFQIKYYKRMILHLRQRNDELETVINSKTQHVAVLEGRINEQQRLVEQASKVATMRFRHPAETSQNTHYSNVDSNFSDNNALSSKLTSICSEQGRVAYTENHNSSGKIDLSRHNHLYPRQQERLAGDGQSFNTQGIAVISKPLTPSNIHVNRPQTAKRPFTASFGGNTWVQSRLRSPHIPMHRPTTPAQTKTNPQPQDTDSSQSKLNHLDQFLRGF